MAKSRAEVLASLRNIFESEPKTKAEKEPAKAKPVAPASSGFARFQRIEADTAVAVAEENEEVEEEVEEDEEEEALPDADGVVRKKFEPADSLESDVETSPVEELLDRVEALIDYISENSEALKSWLAAAR